MTDESIREHLGLQFLGRIDPEKANLGVASIKRFLKLADERNLITRVHATRVWIEPTFYMSKSKDHNVGDAKAPGREIECVFILATNMNDFAVSGVWYEGKFVSATIGGKRSGYRPEKMFTQITKAIEEVNRCLS